MASPAVPPDGSTTLRGLADLVAPVLGLPSRGPAADPAHALDTAQRHGVLGLLPAGDDAVGAAVRDQRLQTRARLVRALADLRLVSRAAEASRAPLVAVKGVVLANTLYPRPDLRPFADVDVLTSPEAFGWLLSALEAAGGRVRTRNWTAMTRLRSAEVTVVMPAGTSVDVHWSLVNVAGLRELYRLDTHVLLDGAAPGPLDGVGTLDPVVHLGYVCWHMTVSGGVRLLWACDVELAARAVAGRGPELAAWAAATRTVLPVVVALDYAAALFPGGSAADLGAALPGSPWRSANRRLRRSVVARPVGRLSGAFLPRATRTTTWDSVAAVRPPLRALLHRQAPDQEELDIMPLDDGGPATRAAYLDAVAAGAM